MANPKKQIEKKTISDAQLHLEIIKLFEKGNTSNANIYELLRTKYRLMKQRYIKMYHEALNKWQGLKEKATEEQVSTNTKKALESAVMSKLDRQLFLTKIIKGEVKIKKPFVIAGKIKEHPVLPDAMDRLKAIAELNKMDGDYAPTKINANILNSVPILSLDPLSDATDNSTS